MFKRTVSLYEIRRALTLYSGKPSEADVTIDDARYVAARARGFESWAKLAESVARPGTRANGWGMPAFEIEEHDRKIVVKRPLDPADWDAAVEAMAEGQLSAIDANGQMTDALLQRIASLDHVTRLELGGSKNVTDAGLRALARLPNLRHLDLSGTGITDRGLDVLRDLRDLRVFVMRHDAVSDAGVSNLAHCDRLERVEVFPGAGARTIDALKRKPHLRHVRLGRAFAEADLSMLQEFPVFKTWQGGEIEYGLMEFEAEPNSLMLYPNAPYSWRGFERFAGLDGLFALNLDNPIAKGADLEPLMALPRLGWLGHDAGDRGLAQAGLLPHLRMLMSQDTEAGDEGFVGLSRSRTLEYIWGRRCYNLTGRGFAALSTMPSLRGLSVSCRNVDDAALSTLPRFPALRELMPMDVRDEGFRHVGRCEHLEALWCMYCRDTTDAATEHIAGLPRLKVYYAGKTLITDRSLEILSGMTTLEKITLWETAGVTAAGVARLAELPRLRELTLDGMPQIPLETAALFPSGVRVRVSG